METSQGTAPDSTPSPAVGSAAGEGAWKQFVRGFREEGRRAFRRTVSVIPASLGIALVITPGAPWPDGWVILLGSVGVATTVVLLICWARIQEDLF